MRGKQAPKREIKADAIYNSVLVSKMINYVMMEGKKKTASNIIYSTIDELNIKTKSTGIEALEKAIENVKPKVEVRSKRVGGSNFQVPVQVSESRQLSLAVKWILEAARSARKTDEFYHSLTRELMNAFNKEGSAIKKREEIHKMAEANKAFAQFA